MELITEVAKSQNTIIITTIHQPSSKIYDAFDQIMILADGREAYYGQADDAPSYFASLGYQMKAGLNPAEFFLDLVNSDFTPQEAVDKVLDAWQVKKEAEPLQFGGDMLLSLPHTGGHVSVDRSTLAHEIEVMLRRHGLLVFRDPLLYIYRIFFYLVLNCLIAFVFWPARYRVQDEVRTHM